MSSILMYHPLYETENAGLTQRPAPIDASTNVGRFDLTALCGCRTLNFCLFVCLLGAVP